MKVRKRIVIAADVLVDEDFDCRLLYLAKDIGDEIHLGEIPVLVVGDHDFEVIDYVDYVETEIKEDENL